ncbi:ABC transporter substrate-binding protein [Arthrobacter sp. B2a2-09]|uniref:ABC transporter substrate-binding protein n=1 Tax=Arthrobacter sp. B2a2-09 TaxID=2952822 RepID=UPI0022CD7D33|nr:ABC transporter substrate-binding protein [Arthrobacter sp. B2a2-09]MCZ9882259.1 ABC transporter substrate-binding protein [Arthrobacter sp. B2a2-09]
MRTPKPLALLPILLMLGVTGCSSPVSTAGAAQTPASTPAVKVNEKAAALVPAAVKSKGTLVFAMDASYAPFEFFDTDNTTITGFDANFSDAVAAAMGLKSQKVNTNFAAILPGLQAGKYDIGNSNFTITPEREKTVDFVPFMKSGSGLGVKKGNPENLSMDFASLCGHHVAAQTGTVQALTDLPELTAKCASAGKPAIDVQLFATQNDANLALSSGRVDALMADSVGVAYQGEQSNGAFELVSGPLYKPSKLGIALPKGSPLIPALTEAVNGLIKDGTYAAIAKTWKLPVETLMTPGS